MQRISLYDANVLDASYNQKSSPFKGRKGRNSVMNNRGTIDLSVQSMNINGANNQNAENHFRTMKNTARNSIGGGSPPPSVLYEKDNS